MEEGGVYKLQVRVMSSYVNASTVTSRRASEAQRSLVVATDVADGVSAPLITWPSYVLVKLISTQIATWEIYPEIASKNKTERSALSAIKIILQFHERAYAMFKYHLSYNTQEYYKTK